MNKIEIEKFTNVYKFKNDLSETGYDEITVECSTYLEAVEQLSESRFYDDYQHTLRTNEEGNTEELDLNDNLEDDLRELEYEREIESDHQDYLNQMWRE